MFSYSLSKLFNQSVIKFDIFCDMLQINEIVYKIVGWSIWKYEENLFASFWQEIIILSS